MSKLSVVKNESEYAIFNGKRHLETGFKTKEDAEQRLEELFASIQVIYDNKGKTYDRYTIVVMDDDRTFDILASSVGICTICEDSYVDADYDENDEEKFIESLGYEINFEELPELVQKQVDKTIEEWYLDY